jgi:hypothetical protein
MSIVDARQRGCERNERGGEQMKRVRQVVAVIEEFSWLTAD